MVRSPNVFPSFSMYTQIYSHSLSHTHAHKHIHTLRHTHSHTTHTRTHVRARMHMYLNGTVFLLFQTDSRVLEFWLLCYTVESTLIVMPCCYDGCRGDVYLLRPCDCCCGDVQYRAIAFAALRECRPTSRTCNLSHSNSTREESRERILSMDRPSRGQRIPPNPSDPFREACSKELFSSSKTNSVH